MIARDREVQSWIDKAQGIFKCGGTILYDSPIVDTWHCAFVKTHWNLERVNLNVCKYTSHLRGLVNPKWKQKWFLKLFIIKHKIALLKGVGKK